MSGTPSLVNLLRIWIGLIGFVAVGSTIQCFLSPSYATDLIFTVDQNNGNFNLHKSLHITVRDVETHTSCLLKKKLI